MELRHLRYFVAVAERGSFTAAAKLRLAQPSLTCQIRNLEAELQVKLFSREKRQIALTDQGRLFLERSLALLAQAEANVREVRRHALDGRVSTLNVGYAADLHYDLLPGALGALRLVFPGVELRLFDLPAAAQLRAFERDELDVGFARDLPLPTGTGLQRAHLHAGEIMAILPEGGTRPCQRPLDLAGLKERPFLSLADELYPGTHSWLKRVCRQAGFVPRVVRSFDRVPPLLGGVGLGDGVALLPGACQHLPHDGVVFLPLSQPSGSRTEIIWKRPALTEPLKRYARTIHLNKQRSVAGLAGGIA